MKQMSFGSYRGRITAAFQRHEEASFSIQYLPRRLRSCSWLHQGSPITISSLERLSETDENLAPEGLMEGMEKAFLSSYGQHTQKEDLLKSPSP